MVKNSRERGNGHRNNMDPTEGEGLPYTGSAGVVLLLPYAPRNKKGIKTKHILKIKKLSIYFPQKIHHQKHRIKQDFQTNHSKSHNRTIEL